MGHQDILSLQFLNRNIRKLNKLNEWNCIFKVDDGSCETRIDINSEGHIARQVGKLPLVGYEIFCPDLLCLPKMLIIEYEEEAYPNSGYFNAKLHKGHTEYTNTRDSRCDEYYRKAKFSVLKIWGSDMKRNDKDPNKELWWRKLKSFLTLQTNYPLSGDLKQK